MSQSKRYRTRCVNIRLAISTELILNASQQDELVAISQSRSLPAGYVFRAKLILMLAEGLVPDDQAQARNHGSDHCSAEGAFPVRWHRRAGHVSSRPAAERSDARLARPDSGRHPEKASRWIDALELPQTRGPSGRQQRCGAPGVERSGPETASERALPGQRRSGFRIESRRHQFAIFWRRIRTCISTSRRRIRRG